MTTRRKFIFFTPAAIVMLSACSFKIHTCEKKQKRSIKKIIGYINAKLAPLQVAAIDLEAVNILSVISGLSEVIGEREIMTDAEAAAVIVKSIRNDSDRKNYVVLGGMTVTRTEGFFYLVKSQQNFSVGSDQSLNFNGCQVQK